MSRRVALPLIALGVIAFLVISFFVARWLSTENNERDAVYAVLQAEARGDAGAMLGRLDGCVQAPRCRATVRANARRLRRPGEVKILAYDSATAYALGGASGPTRVAWTVVDRGLPVVQCVDVRRTGSVLGGRAITLEALSPPIGNEASC